MSRYKFIQPRLLNTDEAGEYVGAPAFLKKMVSAGWIRTTVNQRKLKFYDRTHLDHCCDRLAAGEFPGE